VRARVCVHRLGRVKSVVCATSTGGVQAVFVLPDLQCVSGLG